MDTSDGRPEVAGAAELNISPSVITCSVAIEILGPSPMEHDHASEDDRRNADCSLFRGPTKCDASVPHIETSMIASWGLPRRDPDQAPLQDPRRRPTDQLNKPARL
jgi:hypothetical protein